MHNLRDKLLSAGFVTEAQTAQAETSEKKNNSSGPHGRKTNTAPRSLYGNSNGNRAPSVDSKMIPVLKAIDEHRIRGDVRGTEEFHFEDRTGAIRKMLVTKEIAHGLTAGRMAIVESGDQKRHIIVGSSAIKKIRRVDALMIRSFNDDVITA